MPYIVKRNHNNGCIKDKFIIEVENSVPYRYDNSGRGESYLEFYLEKDTNELIKSNETIFVTEDEEEINLLLNIDKMVYEIDLTDDNIEGNPHISSHSNEAKKPFESSYEAKMVALEMFNKTYRKEGIIGKWIYYVCPVCGKYHIGKELKK